MSLWTPVSQTCSISCPSFCTFAHSVVPDDLAEFDVVELTTPLRQQPDQFERSA
jgi:hypothetical protein